MADRNEPGRGGAAADDGVFGVAPAGLAAVVTALWLGLVVLYAAFAPEAAAALLTGGGIAGGVVTVLGVAMPVVLIWVVAAIARAARELRVEAMRLQAALDAMRGETGDRPAVELRALAGQVDARLQELLAAQRRAEKALAAVAAHQSPATGVAGAAAAAPGPAAQQPPPDAADAEKPALAAPPARDSPERQAMLSLGPAEAPAAAVSVADFLRALNFPDTAEDAEGFRALTQALRDPRAARLIRAAQDVLTLLSEDGLYMDDLPPEPAGPELWRRFARGGRGGAVARLGGIQDAPSLGLAAQRLREDAVYRDAVHHFLRQFDRMLEGFEPNATDAELAALADTRSARAFMLLGRVTGIFD